MIQAVSEIGMCNGYIGDSGEESGVNIVVSPLRVVEGLEDSGDTRYRIYWGCSRYYWCENRQCEFSRRFREELKAARSSGDYPSQAPYH